MCASTLFVNDHRLLPFIESFIRNRKLINHVEHLPLFYWSITSNFVNWARWSKIIIKNTWKVFTMSTKFPFIITIKSVICQTLFYHKMKMSPQEFINNIEINTIICYGYPICQIWWPTRDIGRNLLRPAMR